MLVPKTISVLWPFLKEMVLGDITLKESLKHHKKKAATLGLLVLLLLIVTYTVPKLFRVSQAYMRLQNSTNVVYVSLMEKRVKTLEAELLILRVPYNTDAACNATSYLPDPNPPPPVVIEPVVSVVIPTTPTGKPDKPQDTKDRRKESYIDLFKQLSH